MGTSIKIAGQNYKVESMPKKWVHHTDTYGQCDTEHLAIHLATNIPESRKGETLLHEVLHAIYYEYGLSHVNDEEGIVSLLSVGLYQVLKDNEELRGEIWDGT